MQTNRRIKRSLRRLHLVVLIANGGLAHAAEFPDLAALQEAVWSNLDAVRDLRVVVDRQGGSANPENEGMVRRFEWVFRDDGLTYFVASQRFRPDEQPGAPTFRQAYDGQSLRTVGYDREAPYLPRFGKIYPPENVYRELTAPACYLAEFGRAWGAGINNKSIGEWLQSRGARTVGRETVNGYDCAVVEVPAPLASKPDQERYNRFYLASDMAFALVGWDTMTNAEVTFRVRSDRFEEVLPGVWFPLSGTIQAPGRKNRSPQIPAGHFEVVSLRCNKGIPDEAFEIEFEPGLPVYDHRVGMPMLWEQGLNRSADIFRMLAPDIYKEPTEEGAQRL